MTAILIVLMIIIVVICAIKWFNYWIISAALLLYLQGKGYTLPSDEETKACMKAVIQNLIKYGLKGM